MLLPAQMGSSTGDLILPHQPYHDEYLQTMGKIIHWSRWIGIVGLETFIWKVWGFMVLALLLAIEGEAIWKVIKALAGWAIDMAGHRSVTARLAGTMFYSSALICLVQCWKLSGSWMELSKYWESVEWSLSIKYVPPNKMIRKKIYKTVIFIVAFATLEHLLDMAAAFDFYCEPPLCLRSYILKSHGFLLLEHEYSVWIAVPLLFMSLIATYLWNFQDLIIILISMGLSSRYQRLNECVKIVTLKTNTPKKWSGASHDTEFLSTYRWRKIREAYVRQSMLVRKVDSCLGVLVLSSAFFNFYFICLQLFLRITHGVSFGSLKQIYYTVSLSWVCIRAGYTVLAAADVNRNSTVALSYLYECHAQFYNVEIEKLQKQLSSDYVALTGMGFFNLNRTFILQMAGAVVTYVLVLIQYDGSDYASTTNTTANAT